MTVYLVHLMHLQQHQRGTNSISLSDRSTQSVSISIALTIAIYVAFRVLARKLIVIFNPIDGRRLSQLHTMIAYLPTASKPSRYNKWAQLRVISLQHATTNKKQTAVLLLVELCAVLELIFYPRLPSSLYLLHV